MSTSRISKFIYLFIISIVLNATLHAEQMVEDKGYQFHYNVFNSSMLTPEIATQYGIERSKTLGVINISVLKSTVPMNALVLGEARNPIAQLTTLKFKKITEETAIYYIATFNFADTEQLDFKISVVPDGKTSASKFEFKQQMFVD